MKKKTLSVLVAMAFGVMGAGAVIAAGTGPETATIKGPAGKKEVVFNHKAHQAKAECAKCHHTKTADGKKGPYEAGKEAKCSTCHELGKPSDNMHKNCKGCHAEKGGPTKCDGCHK
jgi:hypothetical protein